MKLKNNLNFLKKEFKYKHITNTMPEISCMLSLLIINDFI